MSEMNTADAERLKELSVVHVLHISVSLKCSHGLGNLLNMVTTTISLTYSLARFSMPRVSIIHPHM